VREKDKIPPPTDAENTKSDDGYIVVKGARANNLKNIDVKIPRDSLVVITGLSGSGKSSLAFDTLYAEGQRRYVESLSSYARQFLGRISKPECDFLEGIPPAIAIEQRVSVHNSRSTVGTSTEIYEYLRLLFARIGKTMSPVSGGEVKKHQARDVVEKALSYPDGTRFAVYAPLTLPAGKTWAEYTAILRKEGYVRLEIAGEVYRIQDTIDEAAFLRAGGKVELLIDRLAVSSGDGMLESRLAESVETAFAEGHDACRLKVYTSPDPEVFDFSKKFEADGITFREPSEMMFNFNNPVGACPTCEGFGRTVGISEALVVPDKRLSVYEGAVACWKGEVMGEWLRMFIDRSARYGFPIHRPYRDLTKEERHLLWHGAKGVQGIDDFFAYLENNRYKIQCRVMYARYCGKRVCPACAGGRLKPEAKYVKVGGKEITELVNMPVAELRSFFDGLQLGATDAIIARRLLTELNNRLQYLLDVGLGYLTLDRLSSTLSGGESQRIRLAVALGSNLVGSLYILDEPSIGLHSRDTGLLIGVLKKLRSLGNSVVVVEHDEEIIRAADYIIDIGPDAGRLGGEVVYQGWTADLPSASSSHTVRYLTGEERIEAPALSRPWNQYIEVKGAMKNNLKNVDVKFPLHVMTVVTGVSGSGKSSLVKDIFYEGVKRILDNAPLSVDCASIDGDIRRISAIEFVDQHSIGKSSRSNPVTYIGAYDELRKLFAGLPLARQLGYTAASFSFNKEGGRCEECKGEGQITVEMQFMANVTLECEACHGKRFSPDVLEVEYHGVNIYDMLTLTVDQALELLEKQETDAQAKKVVRRLKPLQDVGLGYLKLGQTSSTLSGGENQRVKLACYLVQERHEHILFVFDEPTTGLHFHDIRTLLKAFYALLDKGHTVVVIEHHPDVIKCADHVIDLGPEGGEGGGDIVCTGTPAQIAACRQSHTGKYLRKKLHI
jgi:excinuclease ABC subunit A